MGALESCLPKDLTTRFWRRIFVARKVARVKLRFHGVLSSEIITLFASSKKIPTFPYPLGKESEKLCGCQYFLVFLPTTIALNE